MNIEQLIKEKCPNGMEWKKLWEICEIKTWKGLTKEDAIDDWEYPIISWWVNPLGYYNEYNRGENTVTIARAWTAWYVNFITTKFWVNDKCFSVCPKPEFIDKIIKENF